MAVIKSEAIAMLLKLPCMPQKYYLLYWRIPNHALGVSRTSNGFGVKSRPGLVDRSVGPTASNLNVCRRMVTKRKYSARANISPGQRLLPNPKWINFSLGRYSPVSLFKNLSGRNDSGSSKFLSSIKIRGRQAKTWNGTENKLRQTKDISQHVIKCQQAPGKAVISWFFCQFCRRKRRR